jgi:hypothetical protein
MTNLKDVPDSYRITQRDFRSFDKYLNEVCFAARSPDRMKRMAANRDFFRLMVVALDLKAKGKKIITVGDVRAEQKRRAEEQQRTDEAHREFMQSLGKPKQ